MLALFIMQLIFLAIGILLGCAMKQYRRASSLAVSLSAGNLFPLHPLRFERPWSSSNTSSPFKYFDPGVLLREASINPFYAGLSAVIVAACMVGAYLTYNRRDLYI